MARIGEIKPLRRFERFVADKFAVLALIFIIIIFSFLYVLFRQTQLYDVFRRAIGWWLEVIWAVAAGASNWFFSLINGFRKKILFKNSNTLISANKGPKVLLWILDGCSVKAFLDVAERNEDLKTFFMEGYFAQCVTIFPSITPAAHSTIMTGCYPYKTRIPAFDWVEVLTDYSGMETREYVRCMPDFKRFRQQVSKREGQKEFFEDLGDALSLNQRFLSPIVYTVFETLGEDWYTVSVKEWIHRGADNFISVSINGALEDLISRKIIKEKSMIELLSSLYKEVSYEFGDIFWGSDSYRKLADLMVYWKTGTDTMSHEFGPHSYRVREEVDEAVGKLAQTLRFYKMYTNQPIYVVITADHSQSEVTEFSNLIADFKRDMSEYRVADREDRAYSKRMNSADVIVANNDRAAFFYAFGKPQTKKDIREKMINYLKSRREVDLIFYVESGEIKVIQILDEGSFTGPEAINLFFEGKEKKYPNAVERIEGLIKGNNWGDVVVSMKEGYSLNPDFKPEKQGEEILHGDHGGLNSDDSIVPLLIWGPIVRRNKKDGDWMTFRTIDIASTVAKIFKVEHKPTDGCILEDIFIQKG